MAFYYLDGNAVSYLWDKYTEYTQDGQTGDDMSLSPFSEAALSVYVIDELLTIPIDSASNAYKKHLALLTIFPKLPVLKAITQLTPEELNRVHTKELLMPNEFAGQIALKRLLAFAAPEHRQDLETDLENKKAALEDAKRFLMRDSSSSIIYVDPQRRITLNEAITRIVTELKLDPKAYPWDFHLLCMHLYVATRNRLITVPGLKIYKGENSMLNAQIDFYHLSYLPFTSGFVTNDKYLNMIANEIVNYFSLAKTIYTCEEYWKLWLHKLLGGN